MRMGIYFLGYEVEFDRRNDGGGGRQNGPSSTDNLRSPYNMPRYTSGFTWWNAFHNNFDPASTSGGAPYGEGGCSVFTSDRPAWRGGASATPNGIFSCALLTAALFYADY